MTEPTHVFEQDGDCPLCVREIDMLKRRDGDRRIRFTDIADPSFDAASFGKTHEELMERIHGLRLTGRCVDDRCEGSSS